MAPQPLRPFPCPFCRAADVRAIGGSQTFRQYRCAACEEIWTAMTAPPPARSSSDPAPKATRPA